MIRIGISEECFTMKPKKFEIPRIHYRSKVIEIQDMINNIKCGHSFSANFTDDDKAFTQSHRKYDNFKSSHIVMIDIDGDYKCSLSELIDMLKDKPTIAYTTFSNTEDDHRFRLLYIFKDAIVDAGLLKHLYKSIVTKNNLNLKDNCGGNPTQCFFGSNEQCELIYNDVVYSISNFTNVEKCNPICINKEHTNIIHLELHFSDKEFEEDYKTMRYEELLEKYHDKYPYFDHTPLDYNEDKPYIILPDNYLEIKRYWIANTIKDEYDNTKYITRYVRKVKNGEKRRYKLFINGIIRRFMIPSISFEHLLYNLVYELFYYFENTSDHITKEILLQVAMNAFSANLEKYKKLGQKTDKRKFIVNPDYCIKHDLNRRTARNLSQKMMTYEAIGNLYDVRLKDKENLQILRDNGVDICLKTLKNFKREMGISKVRGMI